MEKTLDELAQLIQGSVVGNGSIKIAGVTGIELPKAGYLTYVLDNKQLKEMESSAISAVLVPTTIQNSVKPVIRCQNPKLAWAILLGIYQPIQNFDKQISNQAFISKTAQIGKEATIEPFAYVGERVKIGNNSVIRSFAYLDADTNVGSETIIHPYVALYPKTEIGNRVTIHAGSIIGADGFGYIFDGHQQTKIPQLGNVIIEDDVEIGACTTIDRATIGSTIIRKGAKIDNLVQIAHNVEIGEHSCLSAQVGISGSSKIGKHVTMGGKTGLGDHCEVGDSATLGAQTGLPSGKVIPANQIWIGAPARPFEEMKKQIPAQLRSFETQQLVNELKKRIEALEKELNEMKSQKS